MNWPMTSAGILAHDRRKVAIHEACHAVVALPYVTHLSIRLWEYADDGCPRELSTIGGQVRLSPKRPLTPRVASAFGWAGYVGDHMGDEGDPTDEAWQIWDYATCTGDYDESLSDTDRAAIEEASPSWRYRSLELACRILHEGWPTVSSVAGVLERQCSASGSARLHWDLEHGWCDAVGEAIPDLQLVHGLHGGIKGSERA
jgi:hypothetical protein